MLISVFTVLCGCGASDVVTHRYDSLASARADQLFAKGWLPDILPPSAHSIVTTNDLDLNTSDGEFSFPPESFELFRRHASAYMPATEVPPTVDDTVKRHLRDGGDVSQYRDGGSTWIFFCQPARGHCAYTMWLTQPS